nr:MAG TPA: zinc peptidase inactive subunit [Bacteriophage sp.]
MEVSKKRYILNIIRKSFRYLNEIDKIGLGFRTERSSKNSMGIVYYKDGEPEDITNKNWLDIYKIDKSEAYKYLKGLVHKEISKEPNEYDMYMYGYISREEFDKEYEQVIREEIKNIILLCKELPKEEVADVKKAIKEAIKMSIEKAYAFFDTLVKSASSRYQEWVYNKLMDILETVNKEDYKDVIVKELKRVI